MIYGYVGIIGSGKTLGAIIQAYRDFTSGEKVYSTMPLSFEHIPVRDANDFLNCKDGTLLGDELWFTLDSRFSRSKQNAILATILLRSRKQMLNIIYTEQHITQIDVRIRRNTQFFVESRIDPYFDKIAKAEDWVNRGGHFELEQQISDTSGIPVDHRYYSNVEQYFPLYDTTADPYILSMESLEKEVAQLDAAKQRKGKSETAS